MTNLDLAFVLDSSGSVSDQDYERSKNFTADVLDGFTIGDGGVRVAVIAFSSTVIVSVFCLLETSYFTTK